MATSFKSVMRTKNAVVADSEDNLETGRIWGYSNATTYTTFYQNWCWVAPAAGTAIIEIWGGGGSSARGCCCGSGGLGGNAGAYVKKTITVAAGCYVCGNTGMTCGSPDLCFRGCSEATCVCWYGNGGTNGCLCAQGGKGGVWYCSTGTPLYCCFVAGGFCHTNVGAGCGIICNYCPGGHIAGGYGGDVNCSGGFACTSFYGCLPNCICLYQQHMPSPAGMVSYGGGVISFSQEGDVGHSNWNGSGWANYMNAIATHGRQPGQGIPATMNCWNGGRSCGCYEWQGCVPFVPVAHGGSMSTPCDSHRDHGWRGGQGFARIKFQATGTTLATSRYVQP